VTEQELTTSAGRREEALFPTAEVEVEGRTGNLRLAHDVGHRDGRIPLVSNGGHRGAQQSLTL
jgi:hypothetical protein